MRADPPATSPPVAAAGRPLALLLAALAVVAAEAAVRRFDSAAAVAIFALTAAAAVAIVLAAAELLRRRFPAVGLDHRATSGRAAAAVAAALALETGLRIATGVPPLLDVLLLAFLRDVVIVLALFSHHAAARRGCVGLAAFLALAASATAADPRIQYAVVLFAALGGWWLAGEHWDSLRGRLAASGSPRPTPRRLAVLPVAVIAVPVVLSLVLPLVFPLHRLSTWALDGFMPTSGGRRDASASARSGIGDGDALVAGLNDIRSFGPIEDAPFVNGHEPSLYDMYDDTYSEPVNRRLERAVSLPPQQRFGVEDPHLATASRGSREFSTVRRAGGASGRRAADLPSAALFHVKGRVPLHLKLESFAGYDGVAWLPEEPPQSGPRLSVATVAGRPWLRLGGYPAAEFYAPPETHAIRVVRLDTNRIPAPNRLTGVHIDGVTQADFFAWAQPGIVRMDRDTIPGQLTLHLQSQVVDPARFRVCYPCFSCGAPEYRHAGNDPQSLRVRELAESWVAGLPRGMQQVERIVERLRTLHDHDPASRATGDHGHSVAEFLFESRRGPDYLFASSAVCMLRSLGYAARLVSGFHADPRRYDARADHTAVLPEDVHFWAEVTIGPDLWLPIEPTPGYSLLAPPRSPWEKLRLAAAAALRAIARHPLASLAAALIALALLRLRARIADLLDGLCARLRWRRGDREEVLATLALLERRCRRAGLARPPHVTPPGWLAAVREQVAAGRDTGDRDTADRPEEARAFVRLADEALYAPSFRLPEATDPRRIADRLWPWEELAAVSAARGGLPAPVPTHAAGGRRGADRGGSHRPEPVAEGARR
jgi:protein-glutamine gamma-glutamyltransferase